MKCSRPYVADRSMLQSLKRSTLQAHRRIGFAGPSATRNFALRRPSDHNEDDLREARQWLAAFETIPERLYDISYSRASGPGGQNVNKTNSKATLKLDLKSLFKEVPLPLHQAIKDSPYCTSKSERIIISSDDSRKQADNARSCRIKLNNLIIEAGSNTVPRETSDAKKLRVKNMEKAADQARLVSKSVHSSKKSSRSSSGGRSSGDI